MYRSTFAHLHTDYAPPVVSANPVETAPPRHKRPRLNGLRRGRETSGRHWNPDQTGPISSPLLTECAQRRLWRKLACAPFRSTDS